MNRRLKIIVDIDTLVKLRFDYISTEIELSAKDKAKFEPQLREYFKENVPKEKFTAYAVEIGGEIVSVAFLIIDERPPGAVTSSYPYIADPLAFRREINTQIG